MLMIREKVFKIVSKVPRGKVITYKIVADKAGTSPRAVGSIMRSNPYPIEVPCHRVVMSDGGIGGYSGSNLNNIKKKIVLLKSEGVEVRDGKIDLRRFLYR
jgi:methylated-DNA-[protein]-cysteine S-methyltransferase